MKKIIALTILLVANCAQGVTFENHSSYTFNLTDKSGYVITLNPNETYRWGSKQDAINASPFSVTSPNIPGQVKTISTPMIQAIPHGLGEKVQLNIMGSTNQENTITAYFHPVTFINTSPTMLDIATSTGERFSLGSGEKILADFAHTTFTITLRCCPGEILRINSTDITTHYNGEVELYGRAGLRLFNTQIISPCIFANVGDKYLYSSKSAQ
jgi:hypothetical protein